MPKMVRKGDLPVKTCAGCGLEFAWRKKWARDWEAVKFCSERCRGEKGKGGGGWVEGVRGLRSESSFVRAGAGEAG